MEIKGKVVYNLGIQSGVSKSGKEWKKASLVVEIPSQYPKNVALDNMKRADEFAALEVGTEGTFQIEVESREYNGRWYTSVSCWNWAVSNGQTEPPAQAFELQSTATQSATPALDSLGVKGYQGRFPEPPAEAIAEDLPF